MCVNITGNHFLPEIWQAVQNHLLAIHKLNVYSDDKCLMFNSLRIQPFQFSKKCYLV